MPKQDTIKSKISQFIALVTIVATICGMVIISQKLSDDSIALLTGLVCGVGAMLPTVALGVFLLRREDKKKVQQQLPPQPPVIVVAGGNAIPGYGPQNSLPYYDNESQPWPARRSQRDFHIVGEGE